MVGVLEDALHLAMVPMDCPRLALIQHMIVIIVKVALEPVAVSRLVQSYEYGLAHESFNTLYSSPDSSLWSDARGSPRKAYSGGAHRLCENPA